MMTDSLGLGTCLRLLRHGPLPRAQRWGLLCTYARLARQRGPGSVPLLGWRVTFPDGRFARAIFREIFVQNTYYLPGMPATGRIVDCGSNVGFSVLYFRAVYPAHRIIGFEPNPDAFEFLRRNCERNGLQQVELRHAAVGPSDGELVFYKGSQGAASPLASAVQTRAGGEAVKVKQEALAPFLAEPVSLLKVDIEGAEGALFERLFRDDGLRRVDRMVVEFHHNLPGATRDLPWFLGALRDAGYGYQLAADYNPGLRAQRVPRFQDVTVYAFRHPLSAPAHGHN
jgi:FkbM family methyltransferase